MSAQVKPDNKAPLLEIRGLTKEFRQGKDRVLAVNHIDLDIQKGEVFGLVGESGCGKSTFGQMLVHLLDPSGGKILLNGRVRINSAAFIASQKFSTKDFHESGGHHDIGGANCFDEVFIPLRSVCA